MFLPAFQVMSQFRLLVICTPAITFLQTDDESRRSIWRISRVGSWRLGSFLLEELGWVADMWVRIHMSAPKRNVREDSQLALPALEDACQPFLLAV